MRGSWRSSPNGAFLAATGGGNGTHYGEFFRPRPWLTDAAWVSVEDGELALRDADEQQTHACNAASAGAGSTAPHRCGPRACRPGWSR